MERDMVKIAKLAEEYRAAYKAWRTAHKLAYGPYHHELDGNEASSHLSMLAYQKMERARKALLDADK